MITREKFSTSGIILAFVGGAAAGATMALLLAPKSGEQTRRQLKDLASTSKDKVAKVPRAIKDAYSHAQGMAKDAFSSAYDTATSAVDNHH